MENLTDIQIKLNPLITPPLEIANQGGASIKNYFRSIKDEQTNYLLEAKLMLVGDGGVGKTSLVKRLLNPDMDIDVNETSTKGIDISTWFVDTAKVDDFKINVWDFGGQEIYHSTHQFFLTKRSLYLLLWEARKENNSLGPDYWLNVLKILSDDSPVIIVQNKIDDRMKMLDEFSLMQKYPNIKAFHNVSAKTGKGVSDLVERIKSEIVKLEHVGDALPSVWVRIKMRIESMVQNFIGYTDYLKLCDEFGLNAEKASFLSRYYHDLGVFLHYQDNSILKSTLFLKTQWTTKTFYKIVDSEKIQMNRGKFVFDDLRQIWSEYPEDKHIALLELMKRFELCFKLKNTDCYIVPELLMETKPDIDWDKKDNLAFEYHYSFMPAGIIPRFIVRNDDMIKGNNFWKNGVIVSRENTDAMLLSEILERKIKIWIRGEKKIELLSIIRRELDNIHGSLNNLDAKEMLPCPCDECKGSNDPYLHSFNSLNRARLRGKLTTECKKSFDDVSINLILGDIERAIKESDQTFTVQEYFERVRNAPYTDSFDINGFRKSKEYLRLKEELFSLSQEDLKNLKAEIRVIETSDTTEEKISRMESVKNFLHEAGVSIANSVSASIIFEMIKHIM